MYEFNLLVSYPRGSYAPAKREVRRVLRLLGDDVPVLKRTLADGIMGVLTPIDPRLVVHGIRELFEKDHRSLQVALKWVPIDD